MAIHASIVGRAYETLLVHPQCPPIGDPVEGTAGLAEAMEAALEAVRVDLADDAVERARGWAVHCEQDAAEARRLLADLRYVFDVPSATGDAADGFLAGEPA